MKKNDTNYCESLIVKVDPNNGWNCHELDNGYILYKGFSILWEKVIENITVILSSNTCKNDIIDILKTTFGHFSIIIKSNNFLLAAVDNIRSIPLYYMDNKEVRFVTDNYRYFEDFCGEKLVSLPNCETEILMSGYSSFQDTLYKNIKTFLPGQIFYSHYKSGSFETNTNNYQAWLSKSDSSLELMYSRFNSILLEVMADTIKSLNGRQVVIPLSGGYDSRIIASTLKMLGCKNVVCFTYGMPNNSEAVIAKEVARKLEYKWIFVELDIRGQRTFYKSNEFFEYLSYVDTIDAVPYYQGIYAVKFLKENKLIDDDAIFINGNGGDFITGGHASIFSDGCGGSAMNKRIIDKVVDKHYSLWGNLKTSENKNLVAKKLIKEHASFSKRYPIKFDVCDFIYYYEFISRQSKYVVQGQKVFEFYGYDWITPLWDQRLVDFWSSVPNKYKYDQILYKNTIKFYNYSGVWGQDFSVNRHKVTPYIFRNLRYLTKVLVLLFSNGSQEIWQRVDRTFFLYYYDITRMMCSVSYIKVVTSLFKYPRHSVSFDAVRYLSFHKKNN